MIRAMVEQTAQWSDTAIRRALGDIGLPAGIVDRTGVARWANRRSMDLLGDHLGTAFPDLVAPESRDWVKLALAKLLIGGAGSLNVRATLIDRRGNRVPGEI